jgi:hypothetical protein
MKLLPALTLLISGVCASATMAQSAPAKPDPKKPTPAASSKARGKPATTKQVQPPPAPPPLPDASEEQMVAVERAYLGTYDCEFKQSISITRHMKQGYLDVMWQKSVFTMKPVLSSTGALRLEDVTGRTLMIQIANKSMLMDTKLGQRMVDECLHPEQRAAIEAARVARAAAAASGVAHDHGSGLGIAPGSPAVAASVALTAAAQAASAASAAADAASAAAAAAATAATAASAASALAASAPAPAASGASDAKP